MVKTTRTENLKILSYNIEFGQRLEEIINWLNSDSSRPDIICLQEFPEKEVNNFSQNKIFENPDIYFAKGLSKGIEIFGELTIINTAKVELLNSSVIEFGKDNLEIFYKKKVISRSAIISKCKFNNYEFSIANVHLTPFALNSKRKKQLMRVVEKIETNKAIIVGDFNYSNLLTRGGLKNLMSENNYKLAGEALITNKYKYKIPQQLDYVFAKNVEVSEVKIEDLSYSDHFPISAEISIG